MKVWIKARAIPIERIGRLQRGPDGKVCQTWFLDVRNEERVWDNSQRWRSLSEVPQEVSESTVGMTGRADSPSKAVLGEEAQSGVGWRWTFSRHSVRTRSGPMTYGAVQVVRGPWGPGNSASGHHLPHVARSWVVTAEWGHVNLRKFAQTFKFILMCQISKNY